MERASRLAAAGRGRLGLVGRACLGIGLVWGLAAGQPGRAADASHGAREPGHRRWAIVAGKSADEAALADLLAVELSNRQGLELVERQELAKVTGELELATCLGAQGAGKRLEIGRLLAADALVLVAIQEWAAVPLAAREAGPPAHPRSSSSWRSPSAATGPACASSTYPILPTASTLSAKTARSSSTGPGAGLPGASSR